MVYLATVLPFDLIMWVASGSEATLSSRFTKLLRVTKIFWSFRMRNVSMCSIIKFVVLSQTQLCALDNMLNCLRLTVEMLHR